MKFPITILLLMCGILCSTAQATPRDGGGNAKAVAKLQAMVRDITTERDALKTERDAVKTQLETETKKLTDEIAKLKQEKAAAASAESRLNNELSVQKTNNEALNGRLEKTNAKLLEVIEKYKALNQEKNELTVSHANLEDVQRQTKTELQSCEDNNIKMFKAGKEVLKRYENKGMFDTFLSTEPAFQIKGVEMETLVQKYEDRLRKEKYQHKEITVSKNTPPETEENTPPATEENAAAGTEKGNAPVTTDKSVMPAAEKKQQVKSP